MSINGHSDPDQTPEPVDCVFLWHSTTCLDALKRAAGRRLRLHSTDSPERARHLLSTKVSRILLVEAEPHWRDQTVELVKQTNALWIAVFLHFDGQRWIEMLEQGAFDVVCAPFQGKDLKRTVHGALAKTSNKSESTSLQSK